MLATIDCYGSLPLRQEKSYSYIQATFCQGQTSSELFKSNIGNINPWYVPDTYTIIWPGKEVSIILP